MRASHIHDDLALVDHDGERWTLQEQLEDGRPVALVAFRGVWCPYAVRDWRRLAALEEELAAADVPLLGVAADEPATLAGFRMRLGLPFRLLSDPLLVTARQMNITIGRRHPKARLYPAQGFLLPGFVVLGSDRRVLHSWIATNRELDGLGAAQRPAPDEMVAMLHRLGDHDTHRNGVAQGA